MESQDHRDPRRATDPGQPHPRLVGLEGRGPPRVPRGRLGSVVPTRQRASRRCGRTSPLDPGTAAGRRAALPQPHPASIGAPRSPRSPVAMRPSSGRAAPGSLVLLLVHGPRQGSQRQPVRGSWHTEERRQSDLEDGRDDTDVLTSYLRRVPLLALYRAARPT
jgi:hypothetical protein